MLLAFTIFRIATKGIIGFAGVYLLTHMVLTDPKAMHDTFSLGYMYFATILIALFAGLLSAISIHEYLYPESED